ncbi:MAG: prolipoprotein diacylglyceryl transferase [Leptospiraceae bacterium]|nr:prolipoprotein diacylglyceryl transferase [Leptospiraceae bacterium]MDW8306633.1 prolipoprotein diacylglyceryl transferase [Leptospiraceae bacterium]
MVWDVNPVLWRSPIELNFIFFRWQPEIRYYGVLFAFGIFLAYTIAQRLYRRLNLSLKHLDGMLLYVLVGLILGAHFVHLIFYEPESIWENPVRIFQFGMGLASHGGGLGAIIGLLLYSRKHKISFYEYADPIVVGAALTTSCIRIGNFFNSEILGKKADIPWGVYFPLADPPPVPMRHPSQLYEAFIGLVLFVIMYYLFRRHAGKKVNGYFFYMFLFLYFTFRFFVEFFKDTQLDPTSILYPLEKIMNMGQWLSLPIILFAAYQLWLAKENFSRSKAQVPQKVR